MIVYLATPYSHVHKKVRVSRFHTANQVAAWIMQQGHTVFSPISHSHPIAEHLPNELLLDHDFWMRQDLPLLAAADELWVYPHDAAEASLGVAREVEEAQKIGKPIRHIRPE